MIKGNLYKATDPNSGEEFVVQCLGMTEYVQSLGERSEGRPLYVLAQRVKNIDGLWYDFGKGYNPAHYPVELWQKEFKEMLNE